MGQRLFVAVRSLIVSTFFISLWAWFIPRWISAGKHVPFELTTGWPLIFVVIGGAIALRCIFDFAWTGLGTPAPFDAPRRFVTRGFYRWVRNPMYVGFGTFLVGEALLATHITREMFYEIAFYFASAAIFVLVYEEPTLRRTFGEDYERYKQHVRAWLPRLTPYRDNAASMP